MVNRDHVRAIENRFRSRENRDIERAAKKNFDEEVALRTKDSWEADVFQGAVLLAQKMHRANTLTESTHAVKTGFRRALMLPRNRDKNDEIANLQQIRPVQKDHVGYGLHVFEPFGKGPNELKIDQKRMVLFTQAVRMEFMHLFMPDGSVEIGESLRSYSGGIGIRVLHLDYPKFDDLFGRVHSKETDVDIFNETRVQGGDYDDGKRDIRYHLRISQGNYPGLVTATAFDEKEQELDPIVMEGSEHQLWVLGSLNTGIEYLDSLLPKK
jgi:hypothetical protein